jgi:hypothetical protein
VELKSKSMLALAHRDFGQVWLLTVTYCAIVAAAYLPAYFGDAPVGDRISGLSIAPGLLALLAVVPFVQTIVWKEKAAGTFLFLRMLPLTDAEILGSKLLVVTAAASLILFLPLFSLAGTVWLLGGSLPPHTGWVWLWEWLVLLVMVGWSTASAIAFTQQRAALAPYLFLAIATTPFALAVYWMGPQFWDLVARWHAHQWGVLVAAAVIWHGWRLSLRLFHDRDFAQLVE